MQNRERVIEGLLVRLSRWPDDELHLLLQVLSDKKLTHSLMLRMADLVDSNTAKREIAKKSAPSAEGTHGASRAERRQRQLIEQALMDKRVLPSTEMVVELVNSVLKSQYDHEKFQRGGRRKLLNRIWRELAEKSEAERTRIVQRLVLEAKNSGRAYSELLRKLVTK